MNENKIHQVAKKTIKLIFYDDVGYFQSKRKIKAYYLFQFCFYLQNHWISQFVLDVFGYYCWNVNDYKQRVKKVWKIIIQKSDTIKIQTKCCK